MKEYEFNYEVVRKEVIDDIKCIIKKNGLSIENGVDIKGFKGKLFDKDDYYGVDCIGEFLDVCPIIYNTEKDKWVSTYIDRIYFFGENKDELYVDLFYYNDDEDCVELKKCEMDRIDNLTSILQFLIYFFDNFEVKEKIVYETEISFKENLVE